MKFRLFSILFLMFFVGGCATTDTVKDAQGQGIKRTYPYAYDSVFEATLTAAATKELKVVESDKQSGRIVLSNGISLWSWGERIAVFIRPGSTNATEVEIVNKPVMSPLNFPPDWDKILLDQIEVELAKRK